MQFPLRGGDRSVGGARTMIAVQMSWGRRLRTEAVRRPGCAGLTDCEVRHGDRVILSQGVRVSCSRKTAAPGRHSRVFVDHGWFARRKDAGIDARWYGCARTDFAFGGTRSVRPLQSTTPGRRGRNARANPTTRRGVAVGKRGRNTAGAPVVCVLRRGQHKTGGTDASIPVRRLSALLVSVQRAEATKRPRITLRRAPGGARSGIREGLQRVACCLHQPGPRVM